MSAEVSTFDLEESILDTEYEIHSRDFVSKVNIRPRHVRPLARNLMANALYMTLMEGEETAGKIEAQFHPIVVEDKVGVKTRKYFFMAC